MEVTFVNLSLFVCIVVFICYLFTKNYDFFKNRGVEFHKPKFFFGNMFEVVIGRLKEAELIENLYDKFSREKLFGVFVLCRPVFVVRDVELLEKIMNEQVDCFLNYPGSCLDKGFTNEIFQKSLTSLKNDEWRAARNILNVAYTNLPLHELSEKFCCCAETILNDIECQNLKKKRIEIDINEVFEKFIADSISSTVLGLQTNDSDDKFAETHQILKYIESDFMNFMGSIKMFVTPFVPKQFLPSVLRDEVRDYFYEKVSREIVRRKHNTYTRRKDILQTFIDATPKKEMHDELITAQIFTFFAGGFKTTLQLLTMCFWELAKNNTIQTELIAEVDAVAKTLNFKLLSYNQLQSMKYLDMFIYETLRRNPPLPYGMRVCNKDCSISTHDGELFKFLKGDLIQIPFKLLQNDAKYFPNPEKFDPLRFADRSNCKSFLAFGSGQRKCPKICSEIAVFQAKTLIFFVLKKYSVEISKKTVALESNEDKLYLMLITRAEKCDS